jgi:hypothetical protein
LHGIAHRFLEFEHHILNINAIRILQALLGSVCKALDSVLSAALTIVTPCRVLQPSHHQTAYVPEYDGILACHTPLLGGISCASCSHVLPRAHPERHIHVATALLKGHFSFEITRFAWSLVPCRASHVVSLPCHPSRCTTFAWFASCMAGGFMLTFYSPVELRVGIT